MFELKGRERDRFVDSLNQLIQKGVVVKIKDDCICLPEEADLVSGIIRFKVNGSAVLIPETTTSKRPAEILPIRAENTHVARHGDRIVARLIYSSAYYNRRKSSDASRGRSKPEISGKVIRIIERATETVIGTLQKGNFHFYVIPDDPRMVQDVLVGDPEKCSFNPKPQINDKVVVRLAPWLHRHVNPEGEITEVLGKAHTPNAEYRAILIQYNLAPEFPEEVMSAVKKLPASVSAAARKGRLDLRNQVVFTIDPDDAKDFDDALSIETMPNGNLKIGIHIADVSAYVKSNTVIDSEARQRANSTYLVGTVIPMLPHALSNGLCSLVEAQDRLTKSVFLTYTPKGKLLPEHTTFANSVIRSRKRFTYHQAYALLFEDNLDKIKAMPVPPAHQTGSTGKKLSELSDDELTLLQAHLRQLWSIAKILRERRMKNGSLDLNVPETRIFVDEQGYADRIECITNDESHQLIEEFMLAANEAVAKVLHDADFPMIHRIHEKPSEERLNELSEYLTSFGIQSGDLTNRRHITALLAQIRVHQQSQLLRLEFLRSMKQAKYSCERIGHFGLNKTNYTHFTSPIRRYSDLIIHRILNQYLFRKKLPTAYEPTKFYTIGELEPLAEHISQMEQRSTEAERESVKIKLMEYFEKQCALPHARKASFDAVITQINNHGFFVELSQSLAYGFVHLSNLRDDLYRLTPDRNALVGKNKRMRFILGQKIKVKALKVDRFKRQMDFQL
jgi:ribonuclease R